MLKNIFNSKIGLRNIKTAICIFICISFFNLFSNNSPIYACISALICLQDTVENSVIIGKYRIFGTILGALIGLMYLFTISVFPNPFNKFYSIFISLGIVFIIFILNSLKKNSAIETCCVVFLVITLNYNQINAYSYALERTLDTIIGILIAIIVNKYFDIAFLKKIALKIKRFRK